MKPEPLLAYALNGEALTREQEFPLRLIMPGWYGVANVKWLARWYRSLRGVGGTRDASDPQAQGVENEITRMQLKSVISRVRKFGGAHEILGFVLNDGTPLKPVEVQIDDGSWRTAKLEAWRTHAGFARHRRE